MTNSRTKISIKILNDRNYHPRLSNNIVLNKSKQITKNFDGKGEKTQVIPFVMLIPVSIIALTSSFIQNYCQLILPFRTILTRQDNLILNSYPHVSNPVEVVISRWNGF